MFKFRFLFAFILFSTFSFNAYAEVPKITEVKFEEIKYTAENIKKYPFLKDEDLLEDDLAKEKGYIISIARIDDKNLKKPLMILHIGGPIFCGTHGCTTDFYNINNDESYSRIKFDVISGYQLFEVSCTKSFGLVLTGGGGFDKPYRYWLYKGTTFEHVEGYDKLNQIKCKE